MNRAEALEVLSDEMGRYRKRSYDELKALIGQVDAHETRVASGTVYQLEIQVFWDGSKGGGDLRVIGAIDDGGWRALAPLTDDFILTPGGKFVGE